MGAWFWSPRTHCCCCCCCLVLLSSYSSQSWSNALLLKLSAPTAAPPVSSGLLASSGLASSGRAVPFALGVRRHPPPRSSRSLHRTRISAAAGLCTQARRPRRASLLGPLGSHGGDDASLVGGTGSGASDGALASLNVVVTGANRGLGFAIAELMARLGHRVVLACRSEPEGYAALERLRAEGHATRASVYPLDVTSAASLADFRDNCVNDGLGGKVDVLFNNAGVCLPGGGAVVEKTLAVNFFGALGAVEACLPAVAGATGSASDINTSVNSNSNIKSNGNNNNAANANTNTNTSTNANVNTNTNTNANNNANNKTPTTMTVVWISSGDGELCFIGGKWRRILERAESLEEITSRLSDLILSTRPTNTNIDTGINTNTDDSETATATQQDDHSSPLPPSPPPPQPQPRPPAAESEELAFGPTPAYSLSKAAANAAVRAWAPRLHSERGVRLVAVCPGDVLTRMTSDEELARGEGVSPKEAAVAVVDVALRPSEFPAGGFYRGGEEIGW